MENPFLIWLATDFSIFGIHFQYWMPGMLLVFAAFLFWEWFAHRSNK